MNRRPEGGPGNLFEIFNKNSYAVWCILDDKFFVIFKQSLSRPLFFFFFLHLYRRINYSCLGASASISSFSFAPKVAGGEGTIPEANLGGVLLNSSNYLTSRHARKIIVDTGYYRRWIGYLWSGFFLSYGLGACEKRNRKIDV